MMNSKDILELYGDVKDDLRFLSSSSIRNKILLCLSEDKGRLSDIREILGLESSTILHGMKKLEDNKFVVKKGNKYFLSQKGKILVLKLTETIKTLFVARKNEKLWLDHEIGSIPYDLLRNIGDLHSSTLVLSEPTDILKPFNVFDQILEESKVIKSVFSIFDPHYIGIFRNILLENDVKVEVILTEQVLKRMMGTLDMECLLILRKLMENDRFLLWKIEDDLKLTFTVTDKFMFLGLFYTHGEYDSTKELISEHPDSLAWGNSLFDYYQKKAQEFNSL